MIDRSSSVRHLLDSCVRHLLDDPEVTEICINRPGEAYCLSRGWNKHVIYADQERLEDLARAVARFVDNDVSDTRPILSAILPDGERVQIVRAPACEHGLTSITIRKPSKEIYTLEQYQKQGFFEHIQPLSGELSVVDERLLEAKCSGDMYRFLRMAVAAGKTVVIAGETNSGKTTLMKALMREIPTDQRIVTIEDVPELFLPLHDNHVHLFYQAAAASSDSAEVTATDLLRSCLRMNPDRIMLAELRGGETFDFLNLAASGHGGGITSVHAGSCMLTFERMAFMAMQNPQAQTLPYEVIRRLLFLTVDVVVHLHHDQGAIGRHITEVWFDPAAKRVSVSGGAA